MLAAALAVLVASIVAPGVSAKVAPAAPLHWPREDLNRQSLLPKRYWNIHYLY
jgi:hypothetical protein